MSLEWRVEIERTGGHEWVKVEVTADGGLTWHTRVEGYVVKALD